VIVVWIVVAVAVLALAGWAFFPRRRGILDGDVERSRKAYQGRSGAYDGGRRADR
jgi:hypothetical protein